MNDPAMKLRRFQLLHRQSKAEIFQLIRYSVVGVVLLLTYLGLVWALVELWSVWPTIASPLAFVLCLPLVYWGQTTFVFRARPNQWNQAARFGASAVSSFAIVTLVPLLGSWFGWPYQINTFVGAALVPMANYLVFRFWVFRIADRVRT